MSFELKHINNWSWYYVPELEDKGIGNGFFTKESPSHVFSGTDRAVFLETFSLRDLIIMDQEHGDEVHVVEKGERPARGDGIILIEPGIAAIVKTADCLPIIIAEPEYPMAAIVHAGWRGTVRKIAQKAVRKMVLLGALPERLTVFLGPSIRPCCYEVGEEVRDMFRKEGFNEKVFSNKNGSGYLDLAQANKELFAAEGIDRVHDIGLCTYCRNDIFASYRRGEHSARQISFVSLRG